MSTCRLFKIRARLLAVSIAALALATPPIVRAMDLFEIALIDFDSDAAGQLPVTGGTNQPTSLLAFPGTTVLVQANANGISTQPVVIAAEAPGQFASVNFEFPPISSSIVRVEATVAFDRLVDCYFLQTGVSAMGAVASRLIARSSGEIQDNATRTAVGRYVANQPFRVRMDVDLTAKSWSVAVDNELDGFDDDPPSPNLPFQNPPSVVPFVGAVDASFSIFPTVPLGGSVAYDDIAVFVPTPPVQVLQIDIKPGGYPNSLNRSSAGTVPVAILSSSTFDAPGEVDPATVTLAGAGVRLLGRGDQHACAVQDISADGRPDLVCHIVTEHFLIEPGDSIAVLEGRTFSGTAIRGEDSIQIVP